MHSPDSDFAVPAAAAAAAAAAAVAAAAACEAVCWNNARWTMQATQATGS